MRRTKEEAERTRHALLDAAEQVFLECGVAGATLEGIAKAAGLTRGAIYWHFKNKAELCAAMMERVELPLEDIRDASDAAAGDDPAAALEAFCLTAIAKAAGDPQVRRVFTIVLHRRDRGMADDPFEASDAAKRERVRRLFESYFERAAARGRLRPDLMPQCAAFALEAYIVGLFHLWLRDPEPAADWADRAPAMVRAFLAGLLPARPADAT